MCGTLHIASWVKEKGHTYDTHKMSTAYKMQEEIKSKKHREVGG
jgi:hypothetical protein